MSVLRELGRDATFALRVMRKGALATATIVLCLGFSIGATATVVAWMEGLVLRPVHGVPAIGRLVSLKATSPTDASGASGTSGALSYPAYRDVRDGAARAARSSLAGVAAFAVRRFNLRTGADDADAHAEPVWGMLTTASYFDVLRVRPALGRGFLAGEDSVAAREPVAVISDALWRRRFAADRAVLGRRVWLNGRELTVVGVAPPRFTGTLAGLAFDVWVPVTMHAALADNPGLLEDRDTRWLSAFGRLAPRASLDAARAEARALGSGVAAAHAEDRDRGLAARTLDTGPVERTAPLFGVMLAVTVLVLLIVCTNVANLLLLRGAAREHELAVRIAVGARPPRLVRQLMTESVLLAAAGVALGLGVAAWGQRTLGALIPDVPLPVALDTRLDAWVVLLLCAVGAATVLLFGLAPALRTTRAAQRVSLTGGTRGATAARARVRGALVGAQFALSVAVLVAAGLFLGRLDELGRVDRGFRAPERVLLATVDFTLAGVREDAARRQLTERLVQRVGALPGVRAAAAATFVPLSFSGLAPADVRVDGYAPRPGEGMTFLTTRVSPDYFETMGVPILRGRAVEAGDREGTLPVVVVNEAFARRFWGGGEPLGRRVRVRGRELTVVGVAADGKYDFTAQLDAPSPPFLYLSYAQWGNYAVTLHVRAAGAGDPLALLPSVRGAVAAVDPSLPVLGPTTLDAYSSAILLPVRVGTGLLSALGGAALGLAALGLYAVISYTVAQRQREIGARMALGATPARLVAGFLAEAARYAGAGAAAGGVLALLLTSALARGAPRILPSTGAARVGSFALALGALAAVAVVAALVPARRATRVSPTVALRAE